MNELIWLNKEEWLQHATEAIKKRGAKSDEELLEEIVKFDYKFDVSSNEFQASLTETQNQQ